ncbi:hypothetical protein B0H10DRAFT_1951202 [Mycena sp. CBHHK59/15]|nr:hypothetical protein B0H10DRAFT_1951202 [Mycena sp. CBHHK59/15]
MPSPLPHFRLLLLLLLPPPLRLLQLQHLKRSKATPSAMLTESLRTLDNTLNETVGDIMTLPQTQKVAPNKHTATEFTEVMGVRRKGAKKRTHTDPYAGGQGSGKQAQPDARQPKKPRLSAPVASTSAGTMATVEVSSSPPSADKVLFHTDSSHAGGYEELDQPDLNCHLDSDVPTSPTSLQAVDSPPPEAQLLLKALALYTSMFPIPLEVDESLPVAPPPRTSYYREHTYQ